MSVLNKPFALFAKNILVGKELDVCSDACILINDSKISKILKKEEFDKQYKKEDYQIIDLKNGTILPGLIECHTHVGLDARLANHLEMMVSITDCELTIMALKSLREDLEAGITTARCAGDQNYIDVVIKNKIRDGSVVGPNLVVSGMAIRALHGFSYLGYPYTGVDEFRYKTRENIVKGADWIKLFATPGVPPVGLDFIPAFLSPEEIKVVVDDAHRVNIPVGAHCIGGQALIDCIKSGVDVIEHAYTANEVHAELFHKYDTWLDYTSGIFMDESREAFLSKQNVEKIKYHRDSVIKSMELLMKADIKFSLGTDAYHGLLYREVEFAVQVGSTNKKALQGVTSNAAVVCRVDNKTGSIVQGLNADIICVSNNPLDDVRVLKDVSFVMKNGVVYKNIE